MSKLANRVSNSSDIVDSRDILQRIEELTDEQDNYEPGDDDTDDPDDTSIARIARVHAAWAEANPEDAEELKILQALVEEIDQNAGDSARDGVGLIRDSYFEDYAQQTAEDIGAIDRNAGWPLMFIDWERAADALKQDYSSIDWDGVEYWVRS